MDTASCKLIAEIGASHAGSLERALLLTVLAAESGADVVKFQKRDPFSSVSEDIANKPHPNPHFSYGKTYMDHRVALELSYADHTILNAKCKEMGVGYACSVWDLKSARDIISVGPDFIKIPSACNLNDNLITYCIENYDGDVHISLGMLSLEERSSVINRYNHSSVIFYHTTTEYPCPFERLYLNEITNIVNKCGRAGFSNHGYGIASDIAAIAMGATYIERHFIDDRTFRHTDAAASLEPSGMRNLKRDISNVSLAMRFRPEGCTSEELLQSKKLRNSSK